MRRLLLAMILCGGLVFASGLGASAQSEKPQEAPMVIKGVVYDEITDVPIPNLGIYSDSAGHKVTDSNSKGEFSYPVPTGKEIVEILPWSPNHVGRSTYVNVSEFKNRVITIYVERGMTLDVHVSDEMGQPVEKASVLWMCAGGASGVTDKKGKAVLGKVSRFRNGCLTVSAPGYETSGNGEVYAPLYANGGISITLKKSPTQAAVSTGATKQPTVKLKYKFTPGELLRYRIKMHLANEEGTASLNAVMTYRQRVKRILPNGDAELSFAVEAMSLEADGKIMLPTKGKMPVMTMVISPDGSVKSVKTPVIFNGVNAIQGMSLGNFGQPAVQFPPAKIKIGDTWVRNMPLSAFATGGSSWGSYKSNDRLLDISTKMDGYTVAAIKQEYTGDINFDMPISIENVPTGGFAKMAGNASGLGMVYFSIEKGRLVRSMGALKIQVGAKETSGIDAEKYSDMPINMTVKYDMELL